MTGLYPAIEPYEHGMLEAGGGDLVYWETCGDPRGKPALVLHGGPGSGCTKWHRRLFDPAVYRVVLFDQRGCTRSRPHASEPDANLAGNNTANLLKDIELLRQTVEVERWLVLGGSWGSTLALAYAESHPDRVTEMVLFGVTTGRREEFDWLFRGGLSALFPAQWQELREALPAGRPGRRGRGGVPPAAERSRRLGPETRGRGVVPVGVGNAGVAANDGAGREVHRSRLCAGVRADRDSLRQA